MSKIRHPKKGASDVKYSTFDERLIDCRKSEIRRRVLRMSNIRHSTDSWSNVENPTSEELRFECRKFDIRLCGRSNRKNPIQQIRRINRICDIRSDILKFLNLVYWEHVCYYNDPKFTKFLFIFCCFGIGSVSFLFYSIKIINNRYRRNLKRKENVSARDEALSSAIN